MEKEPEKVLHEFKEHLSTFIGLKVELFKLNAYERVAKIIAILSFSSILLLIAFFAILFIFMSLSYFLGALLNSIALGFLIIVVIYLLLFIFVYYNKKKIMTHIMNMIIGAILEKDEESEKNNEKEPHIPTA